MTKRIFTIGFFLICNICFSQNNDLLKIQGSWIGKIETQGVTLRIVFNCKVHGDSLVTTLDSPDQGAKGIPLGRTTLENRRLIIEAPKLYGKYDGIIQEGDSIIKGTWSQGGKDFLLDLYKMNKEIVLNRPQEPKPPFPYQAIEVTFTSKDGKFQLSGTLTLPEGNGPFTTVVLVTGSGPQNRDEELLGHKPFLVIADFLSRNGIAVLRYDDRGVAKSKGSFSSATSYEFADDAEAAFDYLKTRKEIDTQRTGIIGHSEGGLIAPIVASRRKDLGFIILLAGPGLPGEDILLAQTGLIMKVQGARPDDISEQLKISKELYKVIKEEKDSLATAKKIRAVHENAINRSKILSEEEKEKQIKQLDVSIAQITSKWFRTFVVLDPRDFLKIVSCPVLALNGANDLQVPPDENLKAIEECLKKSGNKNVTLMKLPGLNHLFQQSKTGDTREYAKIEETFSPDVLKIIVEWLKKL